MPPSEIKKEALKSLKGKWGKAVCIAIAFLLFSFITDLVKYFTGEESIIYLISAIVYAIISVPLSLGLTISLIKLKRSEDVKIFGFIKDGFSRFFKSWGIAWHIFIRLLLPIICLFVGILLMAILLIFGKYNFIVAIIGIVIFISILLYVVSRSLLYVLSYCIAYDNPKLSSKECVIISAKLMKGNRGNYALLMLSFAGWFSLIIIPVVILYSFFVICLLFNLLIAFVGLVSVLIAYMIALSYLGVYMDIASICFYDRLNNAETNNIKE